MGGTISHHLVGKEIVDTEDILGVEMLLQSPDGINSLLRKRLSDPSFANLSDCTVRDRVELMLTQCYIT